MLAVETPSRSSPPSNSAGAKRQRRPARRRRGVELESPGLGHPSIVTVFIDPSGAICHSRCQQPLEYQGTRGRVEVDFYCLRCVEHVSLPIHVLPRIPKTSRELAIGTPTDLARQVKTAGAA
jgi:hypothetical protein